MNNIEDLDQHRKKLIKKKIIWSIIILVIIILVHTFIIKDNFKIPIFVVIFVYWGCWTLIVEAIVQKEFNMLKKQYKNLILIKTLKAKFNIISYEENHGIDQSVIKDLNMLSLGNDYSSAPLIHANYKNINFQFSEISSVHVSPDMDYEDSTTIIFNGLWFIFEFNNSFKSNVKVINRYFAVMNRGIFSDKINKKINYFKDHPLNVNSEEFNKEMNVYMIDQENEPEVLNKTSMEAILKLDNNLSGQILLYFIDNKLHIGIHNRNDLFKFNLFRKPNYDKTIDNFSKDLNYIVEFIEVIKSNTDIFNN